MRLLNEAFVDRFTVLKVDYMPAESGTELFGGNSNWRGPIWFPINFLLVEALQKFHHYYGDDFKIECPTGSGKEMTLWKVTSTLPTAGVVQWPAVRTTVVAGAPSMFLCSSQPAVPSPSGSPRSPTLQRRARP